MSRLLTLNAVLFLALFSANADGSGMEATKIAYLKPIEVLSKSPHKNSTSAVGVRIAYQQACGESIRGLLIEESKSSVLVGVVVDRAETFCLALPMRKEIRIPIKGGRAVRSFPIRDAKRLLLSEVSDVTLAKDGFSVTWQDACKPFLGVVVTPIEDDSGRPILGVNLAHLPKESSSGSSDGVCRREIRRKQISSFRLTVDSLQINAKPGHLRELYALRIVAPKSIQVGKDQTLRLTWEKSCREKAVGVLFTGKSGTEAAIVSALAPNVPCVGPKKEIATYQVNQLLIAKSQKVEPLSKERAHKMALDSKSTYRIQPVTSMKIARQGEGLWLLASSAASCGERLGIIVGEDSNGNVAVGNLADGLNKICHVSRVVSSGTLSAPLVGPLDGPLPKVFSLKVFGTSIN